MPKICAIMIIATFCKVKNPPISTIMTLDKKCSCHDSYIARHADSRSTVSTENGFGRKSEYSSKLYLRLCCRKRNPTKISTIVTLDKKCSFHDIARHADSRSSVSTANGFGRKSEYSSKLYLRLCCRKRNPP